MRSVPASLRASRCAGTANPRSSGELPRSCSPPAASFITGAMIPVDGGAIPRSDHPVAGNAARTHDPLRIAGPCSPRRECSWAGRVPLLAVAVAPAHRGAIAGRVAPNCRIRVVAFYAVGAIGPRASGRFGEVTVRPTALPSPGRRLLDERHHCGRLRDVDGVAAGGLDHRRTGPLGHDALRRRRDHPVFGRH
jgi:hypothetical protein